MTFTVAIVGRPNVGKSTLFNRLTGARHALVDDTPGVTRDRREGQGRIGPLAFRVFDTAGLEEAESGTLAGRMTQQTLQSLKDADVVLLVTDARAGLTPMDRQFAEAVRRSGKPVVAVVNKAEGAAAGVALEAFALGLGEPVAVSAEHGEGLAELYEALAPFEREADGERVTAEEEEEIETPLTLAIIGRPNAGKSTLVNALLGTERVLTGPEAGITRDAIAIPFRWRNKEIRLVDTAGMRRKANVQGKLERLSVGESLRAIRYAQGVVLMMDATAALEKQDLQLAELVEQEGRALVLAVNKWDLVPKDKQAAYLEAVEERMADVLPQLRGIPVITLSAEKNRGLEALMTAVFGVYETWNRRITTADLNRWLEQAMSRHMPPLIDGRRLKLRYMTQTAARPPTFTLFANLSDIPAHYLRYLSGSLREAFGLHGVPLRLKLRKNKNPYDKKTA